MRVLIVSYVFPPQNHVGGLRAYSFAKWWMRTGHDVKVLTTRLDRPGITCNPRESFEELKNVEIVEVDHMPELSALAGGDNSLRRRMFGPWIGYGKRALRGLTRTIGAVSYFCPTNRWIRPAVDAAEKLHAAWPFEVVVSTCGPAAAHMIAARLRRQLSFFWVGDYRDLWSGIHLFPVRPVFRWLEERRELKTMNGCDLLVSVSPPLVDELRELFPGKPVRLVANGFDHEDAERLNDVQPADGPPYTIIYCGTLALRHRDPRSFLDAVAWAVSREPRVRSRLRVVFYTQDQDLIDPEITARNLTGVVASEPLLPHRTVLKRQRQAHALLFLEWNDRRQRGILTGKLFEYLSAGRPILSVGGDPSADASVCIESNGFGVALGDDVERTGSLLIEFAGTGKLPYRPRQGFVKQFERERLAAELMKEITRLRAVLDRGEQAVD